MSDDHILFLTNLANREINRIAKLPPPVVRVCGPLTCDGLEGYARNANRLSAAEEILKQKGMSVWTFVESEKDIFGRGFDHNDIVTHFHTPVLKSGHIITAYFLPRWQESSGARRERELSTLHGINIEEFPEEWFTQR